jgi:type I restriction-modification system DNA methylase subunit
LYPWRIALVEKNKTIFKVQTNLKHCGYSSRLLESDYFYEDGMGKHTVPLAGFASPVHDSRTSCLSVITCDGLGEVRPEYVNRYRGVGAPVVFVCYQQSVQWWSIGTEGAERQETISNDKVDDFFDKFKKDFAPDKIWRAKNLGNVIKDQQLHFVDAGLMLLLEHEMGERLGGLMKRVIGLLQQGFTAKQQKTGENQQWIFQAGFWILCAKILKDKGVRGFTGLRIDDIDAVLEAVQTHYGSQQQVEIQTHRQRQALEKAADDINKFASLSNLTTEAFGYMYENVLVDKKLRAALGIHATPSYLVDYIVWQLWPWIEQIPEDKRVVLEPACGHAPFLASAMRMLRFLYTGNESRFHRYAKDHLIGIETDSFAREIAMPSLTIADVPNPNGWNIVEGDIYWGDVLSKKAKNATILLCNPPFEDFTPDEQKAYRAEGQQLRCFNKAAEMLWRTLPYMQKNSVFGIIMPRTFLHGDPYKDLRQELLGNFEIAEIALLPENVFAKGGLRSVALLGRKIAPTRKSIQYAIIPKDKLKYFQETYQADTEGVPLKEILARKDYNLSFLPLKEIWEYCRNFPILGTVAEVGRGIEYKSVKDSTSRTEFAEAKQGFVRFERTIENRTGQRKKVDIKLTELPDLYWMDLSDEAIANPRYGMPTGRAQVLLNYARGGDPWRLKALVDKEGMAITNRLLAVRPRLLHWHLKVLWAILNSPFANGFVFCHSMERDNLEGTVRKIPVPNYNKEAFEKIKHLVSDYFALEAEKDQFLAGEPNIKEVKRILLSIDAEVMRLYDLPPKMEKRVLDLFQGVQRKGVDFTFMGYYPEGFESAVPLHEYLSDEYQRSTIIFVDELVKENRSPEISGILRKAVEAFEEE